MDKLELLKIRVDVVNKKLLALILIDGGIWIYGVKGNGLLFWAGLVAFGITVLGWIEKGLDDE